MGYKPVFQNQKTSLKKQCNGSECLASEYDNIFIDTSKVFGTHYTVWIQQYMYDVEDNSELYKLIDKLIEEAKNKEKEDFEQKQKQEAMYYLNSLV